MSSSFQTDQYPGRPRILFVGLAESSHTHSWIDLLEGARFNVRLFAMPSGVPPDGWGVRTYVTAYTLAPLDPETCARMYPRSRAALFVRRNVARALGRWDVNGLQDAWLARVIREWRPDIIHTLGLESGGEFFYRVRREHALEQFGVWVAQTRGGSDLALNHLDPVRSREIGEALRACDRLLSDNTHNFRIARALGVREEQLADIAPVPGTGGIDVEELARGWHGPPSGRRLILWPKAYECPYSKALPVFEALRLSWERIRPCEIHLFATTPETRAWLWTLPAEIRESCRVEDRVARERVLEMMTRSRVMLAPSLIDGTPNSMLEAMAAGAFPIVSPLETISTTVEHERNVLFARNLYPAEVAEQLARAMTDDALVDAAAERNLALVGRVANRAEIRRRVVDFYERLASRRPPAGGAAREAGK